MINIELQTEYVAKIGHLLISNTFLTSVLVTFILVIFALSFFFNQKKNNVMTRSLRVLMKEMLQMIDSVTENRKLSKRILPLVATFFVFIVTANLLALIPGFLGSLYIKTAQGTYSLLRSPNSDLTTTLALALFSVFAIQIFSLQALGFKKYLQRFFNFKNPITLTVGFFEGVSELVKILSFSFRLFGNIFAGEVLLIITAFLVPYIIPVPFMILEVFVGIIQAFIFAMLTLAFIKTSTMKHLPG